MKMVMVFHMKNKKKYLTGRYDKSIDKLEKIGNILFAIIATLYIVFIVLLITDLALFTVK